ncbi:hypothetical protein BH11PSE14_BH11PSE14_12180 [soil metagenome]
MAAALLVLPMAAMGATRAVPASSDVAATTEAKVAAKPEPAVQAKSAVPYMKFEAAFQKMTGTNWIAGVGDGHTIYQNSRGEFFYIDPGTGDLKTVSNDYFIKVSGSDVRAREVPGAFEKRGLASRRSVAANKMGTEVTLLGVDAQGNVIQQNAKGEKFYLNPTTGDMVFVK